MNTSVKSYIESLPDELWLQIFAYIRVYDLYTVWRNLNSRINSIIHSVYISIYITNKNEGNISYQDLLTYFSSQIVHIKDERVGTTLPIDLLSFINLRSLYLASCSTGQLEQILNLHQLTRLSLPCDYVGGNLFKKFIIGKDRGAHFPNLRSIGRIMTCYIDDSITVNRNIQHVHIVALTSESIPMVLKYLPEVRLISIDYLANERVSSGSCFIMAKIRHQHKTDLNNISASLDISSKAYDRKKLKLYDIAKHIYQLDIDFHGHCDFAELVFVLQQCPILEKVRIRIKYYPDNLDLSSIRSLNPFLSTLNFGEIQKDTGKSIIITN